MNKLQVEKNKKKLTQLILDGKWNDAEQLIEKFKDPETDKKDTSSRYAYFEFENLIGYRKKEKDQWLKDIQQGKYLSKCIDKELRDIVDTALYAGYDKALCEIEEARPYSPTSACLYRVMAVINYCKGDLKRYFEIENSEEYQFLHDLGDSITNLVEEEGKYTQAIKLIDMHLEQYPEDHLMLFYKGLALYKQGEIESAKTLLKKSLSSKRSKYAIYYLLEITKNKGENSEALVYVDQMISILEDEIHEREGRLEKEEEKTGIYDVWSAVHLKKAMFDRANILLSLGRTQESVALLKKIIDRLERIVHPKWIAASKEDPMYVVDAYHFGSDTPGTEIDKLYENATSLLSQLDSSYRAQQTQSNNSGCFSVFIFIIITIGVIGITVF